MKIKKVFTTVVVEVSENETISFSKDNDASMDDMGIVSDDDLTVYDLYTEEEITKASNYAADEFRRRNV